MTFHRSRSLIALAALGLLAGCAGSSSGDSEAVYTVPSAPPPAYAPPVSESYIIQRAPTVVQAIPIQQSPNYQATELFEVAAAENARREAEARRAALDELVARIATVRAENSRLREERRQAAYEGGFAPFEVPEPASVSRIEPDASEEAEIAAARAAVADAEAAAVEAAVEARRAVREKAAETVARREASKRDRANPRQARRPILGRFATRTPPPAATGANAKERAAPSRPADTAPTPRSREVAALTVPDTVPSPPRARPAPAPRPAVERAPIPGLKPYILARSPSPTAKPRRAKPERDFDIRSAAVLPGSTAASVAPAGVDIPRAPDTDLSARFFPTPGKPSTLGTDRDTSLDLVSIDAAPYGIGSSLGNAVDGEEATAEWTDAVRLIENGEVEALAILEDADLQLTLCSGRSILTTPPDLSAAATLTAPQIICGQDKRLELR